MSFFSSSIEQINSFIININGFLWGYILIFILMASGIYFSIRTKFFAVRMLGHAFTLLKSDKQKSENHISPFEALSTSLASLVGVGSIAGMAIAISLGGPGAIFWIWVISFLGMSTSLIEHTLGQVYKQKGPHKLFVGGPSYYLTNGLNNKFMAKCFAILLIFTYGISFNTVQANTISASLNHTFEINHTVTGVILLVVTALIIFGGVKRIVTYSNYLVPLMGGLYLLLAIGMIVINITYVPEMFKLIFSSAFGFGQAAAGGASYMFIHTAIVGIKRALFSTEAGMGSAPNISASANVDHPVQQGIVGTLGVFFVAFVVCTATAFMILLGGNTFSGEMQGVELVQNSLSANLGNFSVYILAFCIIIFGFTSIIGNFSYAENNMGFLRSNRIYVHMLRVVVLIAVYIGTLLNLNFVWNLADLSMGLMIIINLYAIAMLSNVAIKVVKDYETQKKANKTPVFKSSSIPELKKHTDNVWK